MIVKDLYYTMPTPKIFGPTNHLTSDLA